jgi:hypothetical protein
MATVERDGEQGEIPKSRRRLVRIQPQATVRPAPVSIRAGAAKLEGRILRLTI